MKKAAKWAMLLMSCICNAGRMSIFPRSKRRIFAGCVALIGGLLLASSLVEAGTVEEDDILVIDVTKLVRVDGKTGVRSVLSDFRNPAQGPIVLRGEFLYVAVGRGQIFVSGDAEGIFVVDPRTGHRRLVSKNNWPAQYTGPGLAVDAFGRIIEPVDFFRTPFSADHTDVVRIDPRTDERVAVTDLSNPTQGADLSCWEIFDITVERQKQDREHPWTDREHASEDEEHPFEAILITTINRLDSKQNAIYRVDPVTGHRSLLSDLANPAQGAEATLTTGLGVEHSGTILADAVGLHRNLLLRIDPKSGNRTILSDFDNPAQGPLGTSPTGVAVQHSGDVVVAATNLTLPNLNSVLLRIDPHTGRRVLFSDPTNSKQGPSFTYIWYIAVVPHNAGFPERPHEAVLHQPPAGSFINPFGPIR